MNKEELRRQYILEKLEEYPSIDLYPMDREFVDDIKRAGLIIVGGRGTGKSNVAKIITCQLINEYGGNIQTKISDTCQNWIHNFSPIPYQHITSETVFPDEVYLGNDEDFLYDVEVDDVDAIQDVIGQLVMVDYGLQRIYKKEDLMDEWVIWVIEEAQNILGTYAMNGKRGKIWLKIVSESRNFNINFIFIGQRLADISTKAVERCDTYLFGKMVGDNDLKKVGRICGKDEGVQDVLPSLNIGEFIFWNGEEAKKVKRVPLFNSDRKPYLWEGGMGV